MKLISFFFINLLWWVPFGICWQKACFGMKRDEFVSFWKKQFEENVREQWIFYDGAGN